MSRISLWALSIFAPSYLFCQPVSIHGTVREAGTGRPIANASVYYNGSLTGTVTDSSGTFSLPSKDRNVPIVVSCIGYHSKTVTVHPDTPLPRIMLLPKTQELDAVAVRADGISRKEKEKQFTREFLGTSDFALSCVIDNLDEVGLAYNKKNGTLTAYCDRPLRITNKKLGYRIHYYLDHFVKTAQHISYAGNYIFEDTIDPGNREDILRDREKAFQGSRMQFVRALYGDRLQENGFKIYTPLYDRLAEKDVVWQDTSSQKFIRLKQRLLVTHEATGNRFSHVLQKQPSSYINENGFYDAGLQWDGPIAAQRTGDLLPYEFRPVKDYGGLASYIAAGNGTPVDNKAPAAFFPVANRQPPTLLLDQYEMEALGNIVLVPNNRLDDRLVVKKWQVPVRYKLYGSFGKTNDQQIVRFMARLADLTGLTILPATDSGEVNFHILVGGSPDRFSGAVTPEAISYLKLPDNDGYYYTVSGNGLVTMVLLIGFHQHPSQQEAWQVVQKMLVKGFGFFGTVADREESIFYRYAGTAGETMAPFDTKIIRSLYDTGVLSGMTRQELQGVLRPGN